MKQYDDVLDIDFANMKNWEIESIIKILWFELWSRGFEATIVQNKCGFTLTCHNGLFPEEQNDLSSLL